MEKKIKYCLVGLAGDGRSIFNTYAWCKQDLTALAVWPAQWDHTLMTQIIPRPFLESIVEVGKKGKINKHCPYWGSNLIQFMHFPKQQPPRARGVPPAPPGVMCVLLARPRVRCIPHLLLWPLHVITAIGRALLAMVILMLVRRLLSGSGHWFGNLLRKEPLKSWS